MKTKVNCPLCKSENTKLVEKLWAPVLDATVITEYRIDSYYSCQNCGIRFDEIESNETQNI